MTQPKDYKETPRPMPVQDREAESSSKYSALFTGLILVVLTSFLGTLGWGFNHFSNEFTDFKTKVINGMDKINESLMIVRSDGFEIKADVRVLRKDVNVNSNRISILEEINRK